MPSIRSWLSSNSSSMPGCGMKRPSSLALLRSKASFQSKKRHCVLNLLKTFYDLDEVLSFAPSGMNPRDKPLEIRKSAQRSCKAIHDCAVSIESINCIKPLIDFLCVGERMANPLSELLPSNVFAKISKLIKLCPSRTRLDALRIGSYQAKLPAVTSSRSILSVLRNSLSGFRFGGLCWKWSSSLVATRPGESARQMSRNESCLHHQRSLPGGIAQSQCQQMRFQNTVFHPSPSL
ncbi:hypothetical protein KC363_g158 [Hortaea werneckii]|nr:hypothetical protein KC363_g158 [Hortaea werneckii]